ncbi:MAG: hypothetical protein HYV04_01210 [Deltaproteobacteria bacterium]|nr:hypothetical protein [Deltaproteobacteria bacterium]
MDCDFFGARRRDTLPATQNKPAEQRVRPGTHGPIAIGLVAAALIVTSLRAKAAEVPAAWKTYSDSNCGIVFNYPPSSQLRVSAAKDYCALSDTSSI